MLAKLSISDIASPSSKDRVSQAVSIFESRLSKYAKIKLQKIRHRTKHNPPSDQDVYRIAAELDQKMALDKSHTRAYGPCLIPLLQSMQQLAALDDRPWIVVVFCLRYVAQHDITFGDTALLFMTIGQSAPRYQSLTAYYPDSKGLTKSLREYAVAIVWLCSDIYQFTFKSFAGKGLFAISTFARDKCERLTFWAESIKQDVIALNSVDYQISNGLFLTTARERKITRQHQENKNKALESISIMDHQASWKHIRKQVTTKPFLKQSKYQSWRKSPTSATLLCVGKRGVGKSVALAGMVDDLRCLHPDSIVTYFFCTCDDPKSLDPQNIISSFVQQLLQAFPVQTFTKPHLGFELHEEYCPLVFLLPHVYTKRTYFVLDGLHECSKSSRERILKYLRMTQGNWPLLLCISDIEGSDEYDIGTEPKIYLPLAISRIFFTVDDFEMTKFIRQHFDHYLNYEPWNRQDYQENITRICLESKVSYSMVRLYLLYLHEIDRDIRPCAELLKDPSHLLTQLIRHGGSYQSIIRDLVELTLTAIEPLTLIQLRESHSIGSYITTLYQESDFWTIQSILKCYGGLFTIDEEQSTVHIVYRSLLESLSSNSTSNPIINMTKAHQKMAKICLTSLTDKSDEMATFIQAKTTSSKVIFSKQTDWQQDSKTPSTPTSDFDLAFRAYAAKYWLWHFIHIHPEDSSTINLARTVLNQTTHETNHPGLPTQSLVEWAFTNNYTTILALAIQSGMHAQAHQYLISAVLTNDLATLQLLTRLYPFHLDSLTHNGAPLLHLALAPNNNNNEHKIATYLLHHGATQIDHPDQANRTALWHACNTGNTARVQFILATGLADVNARDDYAMTPLATAVMNRHVEVVRLLLADPGVNVRTLDDDLRTPLQTAVLYGFEEEVMLLRAFERRVFGEGGMDVGFVSVESMQRGACFHGIWKRMRRSPRVE